MPATLTDFHIWEWIQMKKTKSLIIFSIFWPLMTNCIVLDLDEIMAIRLADADMGMIQLR